MIFKLGTIQLDNGHEDAIIVLDCSLQQELFSALKVAIHINYTTVWGLGTSLALWQSQGFI